MKYGLEAIRSHTINAKHKRLTSATRANMQSDVPISHFHVGSSSVTPGLNNVAVTTEGSVTVNAQLNTDL